MRLQTGQTYQVVDKLVPQGTPGNPPRVLVSNIREYNGEYLVSATKLLHSQHIFKSGFGVIPERPSVFGVILSEHGKTKNVFTFSKLLKGYELWLIDPRRGEAIPILNVATKLGTLWNVENTNRAGMIKILAKAIDLFHLWKRDGILPSGIRQKILTGVAA